MRGKGFIRVVICALFSAISSDGAFASYVSIQHNLVNGSPDTAYNATTKLLTWDATDSNLVTLNDPTSIGGTITNTAIHLSTTFLSYNAATKKAAFTGGSFSLQFMRDGLGPYSISGPISGMIMTTTSSSGINGEGLFDAGTPFLPGSNDWPDGGGLSSIKSLTIKFSGLPGGVNYDWTSDISGRAETQYSLFPNASAAPEPVSLVMLVMGSAGVLLTRRRRV